MEYLNERPIVHDETGETLDTSLNPNIFNPHKHSRNPKAIRAVKALHRTLSKSKKKTKLSRAERMLKDRIGRPGSGLFIPRGEKVVNVQEKYNPLLKEADDEKPLDPRTPLDPIITAIRKRRKERLQRATHGNAPPIFPDPTIPMNPDLYEIRKPPEGPDLNKPAFKINPEAKKKVESKKCPTCGGGVGKFRDTLSEKEYGISGMCQKCQDSVFGGDQHDDVDESSKEEMFPSLKDIPKLTKGLSQAQLIVWNRAMNRPSSARKTWRLPSKAKKLAQRLADSVLYEEEDTKVQPRKQLTGSGKGSGPGGTERRAGGSRRRGGSKGSPNLIKSPRYGERGATQQVRTVQGAGTLTGSDSYRPKSQHATLIKHQPRRMLEKLRGLIASWRTAQGKARQVVRNIPIKAKFGTSRVTKYAPLGKQWGKKTESDLKK